MTVDVNKIKVADFYAWDSPVEQGVLVKNRREHPIFDEYKYRRSLNGL